MKHRLVQDNDAHWYIIPADKLEDWGYFTDLDPDDEASWSVPDFAKRLGCSPSCVTFESPEIE